MKRRVSVAVLGIAALTVSAFSIASPVTWHMTGEVTTGNSGAFLFPFVTEAGDPIAFDFTFESGTACSLCADTERSYENSLQSFTLTVRDTPFVVPLESSLIYIANDHPAPSGQGFLDVLTFNFSGQGAAGIFFSGDLAIQSLSATPIDGVNSVELAQLVPPDPSLFADATSSFFDFSASERSDFDSFGGRFQTAAVAQVPEPSWAWLSIPGALALAVTARARRRLKVAR